jgi:hypothetical protein
VQEPWFKDGPLLRVEFARQSANGRLTLVIEPTAPEVTSLWAILTVENIAQARKALMTREGTSKSEYVAGWTVGEEAPAVIPTLPIWAVAHGIEGVVWTALPAKFEGTERAPTVDEAVNYLGGLKDNARIEAEKYIRQAPRQINTPYRRKFAEELGWECAEQ